MSVVDASIWVSLLAADDVNHAATLRWFERQIASGNPLAAPTLVLVEVAAAMTRRTGDPSTGVSAAMRLRRMPELVLIDLSIERAEHAASVAARLALRGADAVYVALAVSLGTALVSWDRQQRERSATVVPALSPADDLDES